MIDFDIFRYSDLAELKDNIAEHVKFAENPRNSGIFGIGVHEMGHILERALIGKNKGHVEDWSSYNIYAENLVREAAANVQATPESKRRITNYEGKISFQKISIDQLRRQISNYAKTNYSEILAEAVCDYVTNGENARPLSKEIWKILKRELG